MKIETLNTGIPTRRYKIRKNDHPHGPPQDSRHNPCPRVLRLFNSKKDNAHGRFIACKQHAFHLPLPPDAPLASGKVRVDSLPRVILWAMIENTTIVYVIVMIVARSGTGGRERARPPRNSRKSAHNEC
ncbi:MAG: hypothetical protein HPY65_15745 [Syntrophaceae bacterium]|nr:hypothetical protein [Syntrophaceae bacterium]